MRKIKAILLAALTVAAACSCKKEQLALTYNNQEQKIDKYIASVMDKDTAVTVTHNRGSNRMTRVRGTGDRLAADGHVSFYYAGYVFNGGANNSDMFSTNSSTAAEQAGWNLTGQEDFELFETGLSSGELLEGLRNGLEGVQAGEECEILFSGKYGYGNRTFGIIPANSALLYKIWVVGVSND